LWKKGLEARSTCQAEQIPRGFEWGGEEGKREGKAGATGGERERRKA